MNNEVEMMEEEDSEKINPLDGFTGDEIANPVKAIRAKCLKCSCRMTSEIRNCLVTSCDLYPFRMGKNPYRAQNLSEETRQARIERGRALAASRFKKEEVV